MNKIPTIFVRDTNNMRRVTHEVTPGCEWVLAGEGFPTIKRDGSNVRATVLAGKCVYMEKRRNPTREEKAEGAEPGYVELDPADPGNKHLLSAFNATDFSTWTDGEWPAEALGPKIQGGKESQEPKLYPFAFAPDCITEADPRTWEAIRSFLENAGIEGIVWHNVDGRMAKIKRRDFDYRTEENGQ